jgi:hypothetical protein
MKTLIVGFSSHAGVFSSLIRLVTASKASHAYMRILDFQGIDDMVFQASGLTVNYCNYEYFTSRNRIVEEYEVQVSDEQYDKAMHIMAKQAGKPYSMRELWGFIYVLAMRHWFSKRVKNPFGDGYNSWVCSELSGECVGAEDPESMTPEDLRRWCKKRGNLIPRSVHPKDPIPRP